jgi:DNA excision repair protein ERCC-2
MRFDLDGLDVFFPYERIYLEQHQYMRSLKQSLDAGGHCLLEMPTGTGKTVCLLSLITSYQFANPSAGKLIYCTRTVPEMNHVMEELATVLAYRTQELQRQEEQQSETIENQAPDPAVEASTDIENIDSGSPPRKNVSNDDNSHVVKKPRRVYKVKTGPRAHMGPIHNHGDAAATGSNVLAVCLSSRRNMCVHKRVMEESDREAVDAACRNLTSSWVVEAAQRNPGSVETCSYYDNYQAAGEATCIPSGVYDLVELKKWGKSRGWCPYYLTRQAINHANILVFNYQYMLDPKVAKMVSKELEAESIIVFDEAHNIDSVCIEALSVTINDRGLEQATRSLGRLSSEVSRLKATDSQRLQNEYQNLVNGLVDQGLLEAPVNDSGLASVSF